MNLAQWKTEFLSRKKRNELVGNILEFKSGSPLYVYKMSSEEFIDLQSCLKSNVSLYLSSYSIDQICQKSSNFPQLFVLYAAIWWQREYDGTGMAWDPIFSSIGIDYSSLNSNTRSEMIKTGFKQWGLFLNNEIGNLKFIGNIASQGGLPLKLIAAGRGNLNNLLNRVLKETVNLAFPDEKSILSIIESHKAGLTKSYRQPLIFSLLAEIIITFINIKSEANLTGSTNPLEKLDHFKANWRDDFPLPMDDENARGVLERFIQEGVRIKAERSAFTLSLNRHLQISNNTFKVSSRVDLPKHNIDEDSIKKEFDIDSDYITRVMRLQIYNQYETQEILVSKLAGQQSYRFHSENIPQFKHADQEHIANLKNSSNVNRNIRLANAFELDDDTPWIFDADEGDLGKFLKIGAGRFKSSKLYVITPSSYSANLFIEPIAWSANKEKKCFLIVGSVELINVDGERYVIEPNVNDALDEDFSLSGNRIWHVFQKPTVAFFGYPQLIKSTNTSTNHKKTTQVSAYCRNLDNKILNPNLSIYGPLDLNVKEQGSNIWASKVVVLPSTANYKLEPGEDANQGKILLNTWKIQNVRCLDSDVKLEATTNSDTTVLQCHYVGTGTPSELIRLELYWPNNPKTAVIQLPFPSAGVMAFYQNGTRIKKNKTLSLHKLYGVRIVSLLSHSNFVEIELNLKDTGDIKVDPINIRIKREIDNTRLEIRLIDFREQISDLLFSVDHIDSKVELRAKIIGAKDFVLFVNKYDIEFEHKTGIPNFMIKQSQMESFDNESIENCEVMATRIDDFDDVVQLEQSTSNGVSNGIWQFPVQKYPNGCWIIHPSINSSIQFRPMVLPLSKDVSEDITVEEDLKIALNIANNIERQDKINRVIDELIQDFNHKGWVHIEYLAKNLGHLNLTSLDLWRLFAKNKLAMAALAMRDSHLPDQFVQRFSTELPFIWELVSLEAWLDAAFYLRKQIFQKYNDETFSENYFVYLLQDKMNKLLTQHPSLNMMFEIVKRKNNLAVNQVMLGLIQHPSVFVKVFEEQLFDGEDSPLQNLLRSEIESWPNKFFNEIKSYKRSDHKALLCPKEFGFKDLVINFPFVVAINALTQELPEWLSDENSFLEFKKIKDFDKDWFATAYDNTVARALTKGYVQL